MIYALLLDCEDSPDFPDNTATALGRPLATYPLMAVRATGKIARTYALTSSPPVKSAAAQYGAVVFDPPSENAEPASHLEHLLRHGWRTIRADLAGEAAPEMLVVLFANAPAVTGAVIEAGIEALHSRPELDSAASFTLRNRWNPQNARRLADDGTAVPYQAATPQGPRADAWFPDWGVHILRPRCFESSGPGQPPFPWLGSKVFALKQWGGGPVDYQWQIPSVEYWLRKNGVADNSSGLEPQPKPQLAPKPDRR